ncbi:outer membrane beta-barrel protein [Alkalimarinus coralli]|uniref:outer membrane beta-barrel protein n=1 Tax=Alkalimarinus coralli TaxID=2935863 RepID=UPI00202B9709|nr:outer membrane beta-barrel protein [Alkalimarinus coralli]
MNNKLFITSFLLMALLTNTCRADEVDTSIIEFSPGVGYFSFDSERNLKDDAFWGMGLGLNFSRKFSALLHYSSLNRQSNQASAAKSIDIQKYHIDGMYFFNTDSQLRPYIVGGFGQIDFDKTQDETIINGGLGLYVRLTPKWSIRADMRNFHSFDESYNDQTYMMTLGYRPGSGEKGK